MAGRTYTQAEVDALMLAEKMRTMDWCGKRVGVIQRAWKRAAEKALSGDMADLRNRVAMMEEPPLDVVQSSAQGDHRAALNEQENSHE